MENFEFNPEERSFNTNMHQRAMSGPRGGLTGFFMKLLGTQDETKANAVMFAVALLFFILSGLILWWFL